MVTGYNLKIDKECTEFDDYVPKAELNISRYERETRNQLVTYIFEGIKDGTKEGIADGTGIQNDWFPSVDADVFISHSHQDEKLAKGLAGWLNATFGLKCFIDSCIWGNVDELLKKVNDDYSDKVEKKDGGVLYNYQKGNTASKHVNMMLTMALQKMIDKTEITILLNTDNSISRYGDVYEDATYSPWIYSEIVCTQIVRKKPISEYRGDPKNIQHGYEYMNESFGFQAAYNVSLKHLTPLDKDILDRWERMYIKKPTKYALDYLYIITHPDEMEEMRLYKELFS